MTSVTAWEIRGFNNRVAGPLQEGAGGSITCRGGGPIRVEKGVNALAVRARVCALLHMIFSSPPRDGQDMPQRGL